MSDRSAHGCSWIRMRMRAGLGMGADMAGLSMGGKGEGGDKTGLTMGGKGAGLILREDKVGLSTGTTGKDTTNSRSHLANIQ